MEIPLLPTGVQHLDVVLGGGLPARSSVLLTGLPGSGKTVLAGQLACAQAARGLQVVIATTSAEPHSKLLDALQTFPFFNRAQLGAELFLVSAHPSIRKGVREAREMLSSSVRERRARLLLIDGLSGLEDQWRDPYQVRELITELGVGLAGLDCAALLTLDADPQEVLRRPLAAAVDGIVALSVQARGMERSRALEVLKLRGRLPLLGEHSLQVDREGARVAPRLEAIAPDSQRPARPEQRVSVGIPRLDALLGGGLPRESTLLVCGPGGTGKTLLAAAFLDEGARAGEPGVIASLHESATALTRRSESVGIPLGPHLDAGRLRILHPPAAGLDPDDFAHHLLAVVRQVSARRVAIDGIEELERRLYPESRKRDYFAALSSLLRAAGATVVLTLEGPTSRQELHARGLPLTGVAETVIALEDAGRDGQRLASLCVLKMSVSAFDRRAYRYEIGGRGLELGAPLPVGPGQGSVGKEAEA